MGCSESIMCVTTPSCNLDTVGAASKKISKSLEDEVAVEWEHELHDLFSLWDIDRSGYLDHDEIGRVVAVFQGNDWNDWDEAKRSEFTHTFMDWFDVDAGDKQLGEEEFIKYVVTEAVVRSPEDPDATMGDILGKFTTILKQNRIAELFDLWDADQSGFLEVGELNQTITMYNSQDEEDWEISGWPLSGEERDAMKETKETVALYEQGKSDGKLDKKEFANFILDVTVGESFERPDWAFNRVVLKFTELIKNTRG